MEDKASEEDGIKAVIYLQSCIGITETEENARAIWNSFSDQEKKVTMVMYDIWTMSNRMSKAKLN